MEKSEFFDRIYYRSVINHACTQLWEGDSTLCVKWMKEIQEAKRLYKVPCNLTHKWKLCILVAQLHLYVLHVNRNSTHLWQRELFMKSFDKVCGFFPFSNVEIQCMKAKIEKWFTNETPSIADCVRYIKEVKEFFEPLYLKTKEPSLDEWHSTFDKFFSGEIEPTSSSLKEAFLSSYNGSEEDGLKEWEEILNGTHKDVVHLRKKIARKQQEQSDQGEAMISVLPGNLNECEIRLVDIVKSPEHKNRLSGNKSSGECDDNINTTNVYQNGKGLCDSHIGQRHTASDIDGKHANNFENSGTQESSPRYKVATVFQKTSMKSSAFYSKTKKSTDGGEPSHWNAADNVCVDNPSEDVSKEGDKEKSKQLEENDYDTHDVDMEDETRNVHEREPSVEIEHKTTDGECVRSSDDLVESASSASTNLTKATKTLMSIVKDPYQSSSSGTDDSLSIEEYQSKCKTSPQKQNVESMDSDDVFAPKEKIVLKTIIKKKAVLDFVRKDNDKAADDEFFSSDFTYNAPKRKRKRWSNAEMDWIREGVEKHGSGNWATIRENYPFINRTSVDIKDKYRNMVKNAEF